MFRNNDARAQPILQYKCYQRSPYESATLIGPTYKIFSTACIGTIASKHGSQNQPFGRRYVELEEIVGTEIRYISTTPRYGQILIDVSKKRVDFTAIKACFEPLPFITEAEILIWLASEAVLPVLKRWNAECINDRDVRRELRKLLPTDSAPWSWYSAEAASIAGTGYYYTRYMQAVRPLDKPQAKALMLFAKYAYRLVCDNEMQYR